MGGHKIGHQILLLAILPVEGVVPLAEGLIDLDVGLAHVVQHLVHAVLGGHLQLTGHMVLHQLAQKGSRLVRLDVVKADARADEHLLHPRQGPDLAQQRQIVALVGVQIGACLRGQTGPVLAQPRLFLLFTGGMAEVGGGPAHVVDISLEAGVLSEQLGLPEDAFMTAAGDHPPLVKGQGAEVARPKAPSVVGDGEAHLFDGRNASQFLIHGVGLPHIR